MDAYKVFFYEKEDGTQPVKDFLLAIDSKMRAKVVWTIKLLENNGVELREPYSKHLRNGIYELRTKRGSDITRVLYFFVIGKKIILTNGFIKKTQKTPTKEIERALTYRADYLKRMDKENDKL